MTPPMVKDKLAVVTIKGNAVTNTRTVKNHKEGYALRDKLLAYTIEKWSNLRFALRWVDDPDECPF